MKLRGGLGAPSNYMLVGLMLLIFAFKNSFFHVISSPPFIGEHIFDYDPDDWNGSGKLELFINIYIYTY